MFLNIKIKVWLSKKTLKLLFSSHFIPFNTLKEVLTKCGCVHSMSMGLKVYLEGSGY